MLEFLKLITVQRINTIGKQLINDQICIFNYMGYPIAKTTRFCGNKEASYVPPYPALSFFTHKIGQTLKGLKLK